MKVNLQSGFSLASHVKVFNGRKCGICLTGFFGQVARVQAEMCASFEVLFPQICIVFMICRFGFLSQEALELEATGRLIQMCRSLSDEVKHLKKDVQSFSTASDDHEL